MIPANGECRSCHAPVIWAVTKKGKREPVDAVPVPNGNIVLIEDRLPPDEQGRAQILSHHLGKNAGGAMDLGEDKHVSHYATCPHAKEWRDRARSKG